MNDPQPLPTDAEPCSCTNPWAHDQCVDAAGCKIKKKLRRTPAPVGVEPAPSADGPKELWLQLHGDCLPHEQSEPVDYTSGDVTWCWHGIHDSDVRYVRADLAAEQVLAMGRVPLDGEQIEAAAVEYCVDDFLDFQAGVKFAERHHGIKQGGHHGAE